MLAALPTVRATAVPRPEFVPYRTRHPYTPADVYLWFATSTAALLLEDPQAPGGARKGKKAGVPSLSTDTLGCRANSLATPKVVGHPLGLAIVFLRKKST